MITTGLSSKIRPFIQDEELNKLLTTAIEKISDKYFTERTLALKELWDAFERLKTLYKDKDKKTSAKELVNAVSKGNTEISTWLNEEFVSLSKIGNSFNIRHSETDKTVITQTDFIEYLFSRMFSLINFCLKNLE